MKSLNYYLVFFVLIVVTIAACEKAEEPRDVSERKKVSPPKEIITLNRAHEMYLAYQDRFKALTEFRNGEEDASYGWHSIEFYKNYIAWLEQECERLKIKISGLRLYYVAYPDDESAGEHKGYQTYIYVPTYFDEKSKTHIAFDPFHLDERGNPIPIHDIITTGNGLDISNNAQKSAVANMGEMCKPNCE